MTVAGAKAKGESRPIDGDVEAFIRGAIQRGELKAGDRLGSARELSKRWKTPYGAVRQSLETLAVQGIVVRRPRAGTFISSEIGQALRAGAGPRHIIGLLVPDIRMPDFAVVVRHLQDACQKVNLEVLVSSTDNERDRYDQTVIRHLKAGVGGLVLVAPQQARISLETLMEIRRSRVPVVNYARALDVVGWPTVRTDVFQSAYIPIQYLCSLGRRQIGFLTYSTSGVGYAESRYGLYRALAEAGLTSRNVSEFVLPTNVYLTGWADNRGPRPIINEWFNQHPDVDAICCTHDHVAATVLAVLRERGVRVPEDIAVTGHGNMAELFGLSLGDLTTLDTRLPEAAEHMVRILQQGAQNNAADESGQVISLKPNLILGRSTVPHDQLPTMQNPAPVANQ